ncbi:phage holin family protein [Streptomyces sp. NPDC000345]|uniref:phage holin family protein n=1 Tax=Streptomyces sp. NPDC000345 TaxID=3364537 RepID=UPI0036A5A652
MSSAPPHHAVAGHRTDRFGQEPVSELLQRAPVVTAIAALAVPLPVRATAPIVTVVPGVIAAVPAMRGKEQVHRAAPPAPGRTVENVKADVAETKESAHR